MCVCVCEPKVLCLLDGYSRRVSASISSNFYLYLTSAQTRKKTLESRAFKED